ncbi:hypothetical protein HXX76_016089 [Chlamydomonas incerta]|uniref:Uncharacterized protein n=1 Tax=Chlamydomonas incerta TaxID=51695 RepID=A0A835S8P0_CHLIN|nr:hypothetical protein HXX76_016089 [Chlamydomonas incerta]|eukprot:KAG2422364.1 hypothetical protein HXX76_016089 [Chlamydomonas incerta]
METGLRTNRNAASPFTKLTPELVRKIASFSWAPDVIAGLKLSCKDAAAACRGENYFVITLAQPATRLEPKRRSNPVIAAAPWPGWQFVAHWGRSEPWQQLTVRQRQRLLCLAASSGHGPSLNAALKHCGCSVKSQVLASAAWAGQTAACNRLLAEGCEVGLEAVCAAAEAGHLSLCSLLWGKRDRNYISYSELGELEDPAEVDVVRVAEAACFGGHARVLKWLERDEGLNDESERVGQAYKRLAVMASLAKAAARGGRMSLMRRLDDELQDHDDGAGSWQQRLLCHVALGCPLPVFRELADRWQQLEPPQPGVPTAAAAAAADRECTVLLFALGNRTPDWREKVELVLTRRPDYLAAAVRAEHDTHPLADRRLFKWAAAQPDFEHRVRYLVSDKGAGAAAARAAAVAAAGAVDVGALRFLLDEHGMRLFEKCICEAAAHDQHAVLEFLRAGGEVQLQPIAESGSVEQLEWALGLAASGAGVAAAQGPAPAAQRLLFAALEAGNLAAASHLHARGLAPVLPTAGQVVDLCRQRTVEPGSFASVRWLVEQRRGGQAAAAGGAGTGGAAAGAAGTGGAAGAGGAVANGGAAGAGGAAAIGRAAAIGGLAAGEAAVGLADAEWKGLLDEVGLDGRLRGRFSENQWEWLKAAFLASPVLPHATAASTAGESGLSRTAIVGVGGVVNNRKRAEAASAGPEGSGLRAAARAEHEGGRGRERVEERVAGVMAARRVVVAAVERRFREKIVWEEALRADAYGDIEAEYREAMARGAEYGGDEGDFYDSEDDFDEDEDMDYPF